MTTNQKLTEVLKGFDPRFLGVFLYDQLELLDPRKLRDRVLILNYVTTDEVKEGRVGHFVALDFRKDLVKGPDGWTGPYYFGSYGLAPDVPRNYMNLPNTGNVTKLFKKYYDLYGETPQINTRDFQTWHRWDSLCGVYSAMYVQNPNFKTNPIFYGSQNRNILDHRLIHIFDRLELLGDPFTMVKKDSVRSELRFLAQRHNPVNAHHFLHSL